jgi:hypothetical protein
VVVVGGVKVGWVDDRGGLNVKTVSVQCVHGCKLAHGDCVASKAACPAR